ncbi:sensor histidine kinase [Azospirillum doebereinerae]
MAAAAALRLVAVLLLAILLLPDAGTARADSAPPLRLTPETRGLSLSGHLSLLVDRDRALSFADVLTADAEGRFVPRPDLRGVGQTRDIHWYRLDLRREPGAPADWILELGESYIDHLDLHVPLKERAVEESDFRVIRMGDFVPYSQRPLQTRLHTTPLILPEGRTVTVYLKVDSVSAMNLSGKLWTPAAFVARQTDVLLFHGMFFGVLAILVIAYAALGLMLRDSGLLAYTGYVATVFLYYLFANGIAATFLPDSPGWLMNLEVGGSGFLGVAAAILMWDRVLDLKTGFPRLHRVFLAVAVLAVAAIPATVMPSLFSTVNPLLSIVGSVLMLISFVLIVILIRRDRQDVILRFYLASTLTSVVGVSLAQLAMRGGIPVDALPMDPYQLSSVVAVAILGAGLTLRLRRLQTERLRAEQQTAFVIKRAEEQRNFIAMLSHEFRSPLASIDSAVQMIEITGEIGDPATLKRLDRVRSTTRKLVDLVEMFLSSDALDQGALALRPEPVPLGSVLDSALDGLTVAGAETRVTLSVEAPERPVRVDTQFLGVALSNLVQNALRYSAPDTPVAVTAREEPGGVAISVADQGRGMTPEEVERIGSIYFRAASAKGTKGSGVGLYLTQKIVAAHGGTLGVDSVMGTGSVFTIRLRDDGLPPSPQPAE